MTRERTSRQVFRWKKFFFFKNRNIFAQVFSCFFSCLFNRLLHLLSYVFRTFSFFPLSHFTCFVFFFCSVHLHSWISSILLVLLSLQKSSFSHLNSRFSLKKLFRLTPIFTLNHILYFDFVCSLGFVKWNRKNVRKIEKNSRHNFYIEEMTMTEKKITQEKGICFDGFCCRRKTMSRSYWENRSDGKWKIGPHFHDSSLLENGSGERKSAEIKRESETESQWESERSQHQQL